MNLFTKMFGTHSERELKLIRRAEYEEGLKAGRENGLKDGREDGLKSHLRSQVVKKLKKGKTVEQIAEELEEEVQEIEQVIGELQKGL